MSKLTFWYEFASTYSYLSAMRIEDECAAAGVDLLWHPFLLGPLFQAQGWSTSPFNLFKAKGAYMWRDLDRRAEAQGLPPITCPDPFPQNSLLAARIATIAAAEGWVSAFSRAVFDAEFAKGQTISDPAVLAGLLAGLTPDPQTTLTRARTDQTIKDLLRQQTETAAALGLFGAPSFVTADGELFWGDDRLEQAIDWATGHNPA